jgi:hypothetical protein
MCTRENICVVNKEKNRMSVHEKLTQDGSFRKRLDCLQLKTGANWTSTDAVIISCMK